MYVVMAWHVISRRRRKYESSWISLLVLTEIPRFTTIPFSVILELETCNNPWIFSLCFGRYRLCTFPVLWPVFPILMAARAETYRIICGSHFDRAIPRDPVFTPTPTNSIPRDCSAAKAKFRTTSSSLRMALDAESAPGGT
ncbi:hypothetical protein F4604DRAFT_1953935 [Suillus subluteus]|nr:hypothetical protein F4604DRAFT_1953935 [Suillus subluteus]